MDNPLVGVGVRNASLFTSQYGSDFEGAIHSTYLQAAADMGFVGLGLYLFALGAVWNSLGRARWAVAGRDDAEARRVRPITAGVECALLVFGVGGCFLSLDIFELPYLLLLLGAQLTPLVSTAAVPALAPRTVRPLLRSAAIA